MLYIVGTPLRAILLLEGLDYNCQMSSDSVIVEKYFGRMQTIDCIISELALEEALYRHLFKICLLLTKVSVKAHLRCGADS